MVLSGRPRGECSVSHSHTSPGVSLNLATRRCLRCSSSSDLQPSPWAASRADRYPEGKRLSGRGPRGQRFMHLTPPRSKMFDACHIRFVAASKSEFLLGCCKVVAIMILPQVHLRKPCYDFYFLQAIEFERLLGQRCRGANPRPRPIRGPH